MNTTPTPMAAPTAKAIARRMPSANDETCNHQSSTRPRDDRYTFKNGKVSFFRDTEPGMLPGFVTVPVGPVQFELRGIYGPLLHPRSDERCDGLCFHGQLVVFVSFDNPPARRLLCAWHELGHALLSVYGIGEPETFSDEEICDAMGAFMAGITPEKYAEIVAFITTGEGGAI